MLTLLMLICDFLLTTLCFWVLTWLLPALGLTIVFTWGKAFVVWLVIIIVKMMFK